MDEKTDIDGLIAEFEDNHSDWLDRMRSDFDLYTLKPYKLDDDSTNITSNEPRVFADKLIQTLEGAEMTITVTTPEEKALRMSEKGPVPFAHDSARNTEKENAVERLCYGMRDIADQRLRTKKILHGRTVQTTQWFYGAIRGAMVQRMLMVKDEGQLVPDILPVDALYFSFGVDKTGMGWCAHTSWRDPDTIYSEYKTRVDTITKVVDFWTDKRNIIQIGEGGEAAKKTQSHTLGRVPFIFLPVGSAPLIYGGDDENTDPQFNKYGHIEVWGDSIYSSSRIMYPVRNMILTIWASLLSKSHNRSCFVITPAGKLPLDKVPWGTNKIVTLPPESKIEWINPPDIAMTAPKFYEIIDKETQKADLATIEYGLIAGTEYPSGKAIVNLQEGRDSKITPLLKTANALWADTFEYLCSQYEKKGKKMTIHGHDSRGTLFYQDIKPADIKKPWNIEVKFAAVSPEKEMQNWAKAQIAYGMKMPDEYIYRDVLQMQDPTKPLRQRLMKDLEDANPIVKAYHQLQAAVKDGQPQEAALLNQQLMEMLQQILQKQQASMGGQQGMGPMPQQPQPQFGQAPEGMPMEYPQQGQPFEQQGTPTQEGMPPA